MISQQLNATARAAVAALQKWYAADSYAVGTGLYHWDDPTLDPTLSALLNAAGYLNAYQDTERWWNNANAITALIDYMAITGDRGYLDAVEQTFANGPQAFRIDVGDEAVAAGAGAVAGAELGAEIGSAIGGLPGGIIGGIVGGLAGAFGLGEASAASVARLYNTNFLDLFYDDDGWWALAWIRAYDLLGDIKYLNMAATIATAMTSGWDETCRGGIWWGVQHPTPGGWSGSVYKNAIANELFMAVTAALSLRYKNMPGRMAAVHAGYYSSLAQEEWSWFQRVGLINRGHLINDAPNSSCVNDGTTAVWSYNQGVILSALCDLAEITGDSSHLSVAEQIATAFITSPVRPHQSGVDRNGILTEWNSASPSADSPQFQGIFVRNLSYLFQRTRNPAYRDFITVNADAAIGNMNDAYQFGSSWAALVDTPDFVRQTSGIDLLNAAMLLRKAENIAYLNPLLLAGPVGSA